MGEIVMAVYRDGALHPLQPLNLRESETVRIQVIQEQAAEEQEDAAIRGLIAVGLITPPPGHSSIAPLSERKRLQIARKLGMLGGKPLSEIIIEDRGDP